MTDHREKFIFVQALAKDVIPFVLANKPVEWGQWTDGDIRDEVEQWCHWLYGLAGRIGPNENSDIERMHPNTTAAVIKRILVCLNDGDSLGLLEIRDEFRQGQWAWIVQRLYTHDAKRMKELLSEGEALMEGGDED